MAPGVLRFHKSPAWQEAPEGPAKRWGGLDQEKEERRGMKSDQDTRQRAWRVNTEEKNSNIRLKV